MKSRKSPLVKEAVLLGVSTFQQQYSVLQPNPRKLYLVLLALLVSALVMGGLWELSAQGNISVLKQRFLGQVALSTGTYSARNVGELHQLSWENGLEILETLDAMNSSIQAMERLQANPQASSIKLTRIQKALNQSLTQIHGLLKDRRVIIQSAQIFKAKELYTPVYQEYLRDTMSKITALNMAQRSQSEAPSAVQ